MAKDRIVHAWRKRKYRMARDSIALGYSALPGPAAAIVIGFDVDNQRILVGCSAGGELATANADCLCHGQSGVAQTPSKRSAQSIARQRRML
jgi:hypothetical protein